MLHKKIFSGHRLRYKWLNDLCTFDTAQVIGLWLILSFKIQIQIRKSCFFVLFIHKCPLLPFTVRLFCVWANWMKQIRTTYSNRNKYKVILFMKTFPFENIIFCWIENYCCLWIFEYLNIMHNHPNQKLCNIPLRR